MKKIIYILAIIGVMAWSACSDQLDTNPTDKVSGPTIFGSAQSAESAINGIYRMLYVAGWSSNWASENMGQTAVNLAADLMGEDHLMKEQGQGWFFEDYRLNVHGDYTHKAGRSYSFWNFYYTMISNANYIIASEEGMEGDPDLVKSIVAQAYSIRAHSYWYLIQIYQQTYNGNEQKPGVPIYTEPTVAGDEGAPRGTVEKVYEQINTDIEKAIELFEASGKKTQSHPSHIDYYIANGMKARFNLTQGKYSEAAQAATEALKRQSLDIIDVEDFLGNNKADVKNVLWGLKIIKDQSSGFAGFFSHMDADADGMYGGKARQCISTGLYKLIPDSDARKEHWFRGEIPAEEEETLSSMTSYCQLKFKMANVQERTGDYLLMRAEEMILIKAEAECHQDKYSEARNTISLLGDNRDSNFADRLESRTDSKAYNQDTNAPLVTLMDEILFQRRVELWGEAGRIFDLQRLKLGYNREYSGSNHTQKIQTKNTKAGSDLFILPLPQSEFDGNPNINPSDQNPVVQ